MSWRALTAEDVHSAMSEPEVTAFTTKLLVGGQADPLEEIVAQVTLEVREAIRSCRDNSLHATASYLPEGCIRHAVAMARFRLLTRVGDEISEERKMEYREAQGYLKEVSACKRYVEDPDGEESGQAPSPTPKVVSARTRRFGRSDQDGI